MITITNASREFSKVEKYLMTSAPSIISMKDIPDNTSIKVDGWLTFIDSKDDGSEVEIISILSGKEVYSSQSATFKRELRTIDDLMGGDSYSIIKLSGVTNAGRPFITCTLDIDSVEV